jgi:hypothetical protein
MKPIRNFAGELLRRKVVRVVGGYIAVLWLAATGLSSLFPAFGLPDWSFRVLMIAAVSVIPFLAIFSWKYDIVPPQLVRDPKDLEAVNPALSWAMIRHDNVDAGYVLLKWNVEGDATREKRFFKPVTIGREPNNDIELPDQRVSRHHAVIWAEAGSWRIRDLDSANGTFIGATRVGGSAQLPPSCDLRFHPNGPIVSVYIAKTAETMVT